MKAFAAMVGTSVKTFVRNRSALFFGVMFPIILMVLIGLAFGRSDSLVFRVSVVDGGNPRVTAPLLTGLRQVTVFTVVEESRTDALKHLHDGKRSLVIVIPKQGTTLEAFYDSSREQSSRTALMILERFVAEANLRLSGLRPVIELSTSAVAGQRASFFDFLMPGILAMTIAQTGLMGVSFMIAGMRERLVLKRVMATPVPPLAFLGGLVGRSSIIQVLQVTIIFLVGTFVFGARTQGSLLDLGLLAIIGAVAFFAMGFAISSVSKSSESANLLGSLVNFPMMFLSGTFWPRELMPDAIRPVISYLPLSPLVDAMRGVGAAGDSLGQYLWAIGYLLAWAAGAFVIAIRRFRWE